MEYLGLMYEAMAEYGEVKVSAARIQVLLLAKGKSYPESRINVFHTEKTPQEVLEEFEAIVSQNLKGDLGGLLRDLHRGKPQFKNTPIYTMFLSPNACEYYHDLSKREERKSDENDRLIPQRILSLYDTFVRQFSSTI